jgi:hypothetical protein
MSSIFAQKFSSIDDDHKELSLSKETDFKTEIEILNAWISLNTNPNDMKFLSHKSMRSQSCRSKDVQTKEI